MKYDVKKQLKSFGYAWKGIQCCVGKEQNLNFHLLAGTATVFAGWYFGIDRTEWMILLICCGVVVAAELFNSAIERLVDLVSPQKHPLAGKVKDIAAGAVLVCALAAAATGVLLFYPYLTALLQR